MTVWFVYFRNHSTVTLNAENSQLAKLCHIKHIAVVRISDNCINMEDQRLEKEKEIWRRKAREKRKNEYLKTWMKRRWWGCVKKILSQSLVLTTTDPVSDYCFWAGCEGWGLQGAPKPLSRAPGCEEHPCTERECTEGTEGKAFEWLQRKFPPDRFCVRPIMLQNKTTDWSFPRHFVGIDLSLLLLGRGTAKLPE